VRQGCHNHERNKIRRSRARLPWKRGPIAWKVAQRANEITTKLLNSAKNFYSLRQLAKLLGVSTQPVRAWAKRKHLHRAGPRLQFAKSEILRFINWLASRAKPFDRRQYLSRFDRNYLGPAFPFNKLRSAQLLWPRGSSMTPPQIARQISCHPSLIVKAILWGKVRAYRPTPYRWAIKRDSWQLAFPLTKFI
jgi:hypothetical protein